MLQVQKRKDTNNKEEIRRDCFFFIIYLLFLIFYYINYRRIYKKIHIYFIPHSLYCKIFSILLSFFAISFAYV
jgi:cell division protein FtsW (lipid II flippase)